MEIVSHRVIWSLILLAILAVMLGQMDEMRAVLRNGKRLAMLVVTESLLSVNWGLFIYGVVRVRSFRRVSAIFLIRL